MMAKAPPAKLSSAKLDGSHPCTSCKYFGAKNVADLLHSINPKTATKKSYRPLGHASEKVAGIFHYRFTDLHCRLKSLRLRKHSYMILMMRSNRYRL
jgi:hypothetical protein